LISEELFAEVASRGQSAFARISIREGLNFDGAIAEVEATLKRKITLNRVVDTIDWGRLTGYLVSMRSDHIFTRARDPQMYQEYAAFHEIGHLLDGRSSCSAAVRLRLAVVNWGYIESAGGNPDELLDELVAEYVAHLLASAVHLPQPVSELAW